MAPPKRGKRSPQASKSSVGEKSVQSKDTDIHSEMKWEEEHGVKGNSPHISPESNDAIALDDLELVDEEIAGDGDGKVHRSNTGPAYAMGGGYNALKSFQDQVYSGMAIGGSHTWNYDPGVWKETKEEPDLWKIDYHTTKRRARNAPKGSGAPVGTEYHWLIVAHQVSFAPRKDAVK